MIQDPHYTASDFLSSLVRFEYEIGWGYIKGKIINTRVNYFSPAKTYFLFHRLKETWKEHFDKNFFFFFFTCSQVINTGEGKKNRKQITNNIFSHLPQGVHSLVSKKCLSWGGCDSILYGRRLMSIFECDAWFIPWIMWRFTNPDIKLCSKLWQFSQRLVPGEGDAAPLMKMFDPLQLIQWLYIMVLCYFLWCLDIKLVEGILQKCRQTSFVCWSYRRQ